jgi:hypothetical protein
MEQLFWAATVAISSQPSHSQESHMYAHEVSKKATASDVAVSSNAHEKSAADASMVLLQAQRLEQGHQFMRLTTAHCCM